MSDLIDMTMTLEEAIKTRRSVRGFLKKEVSKEVIKRAFELAQLSPSNSNIQPWHVFVVSGKKRDVLQKKLFELASKGEKWPLDFEYPEKFDRASSYRKRQVDCGMALYKKMGIARDDKVKRERAMLRNFEFFDAPHIAFFCMKKEFPEVIAVDLGIYVQTLMLAFTALGVATCAMGSMRNYPQITSEELGISNKLGILFGLAFGYEDPSIQANKVRMGRVPFDECVSFYN